MARLQIVAGIVSLAGIYIAWALFLRQRAALASLTRSPALRALHRFWYAGWGFDWLYDVVFVQPLIWFATVDKRDGIDRVYDGLAWRAPDGLARAERDRNRPGSMVRGRPHRRRARHHHDRHLLMILIWLVIAPFVAGVVAWVADRWSHRLAALDCARRDQRRSRDRDRAVDTDVRDRSTAGHRPMACRCRCPVDRSRSASGSISASTASACCSSCSPGSWASWRWSHRGRRSSDRVGFFHFQSAVGALAGIIGVFLALDLFLFYFFWEMMLVPMYFLIGDVGARAPHLRRDRSSSSSRRSADC